MLPEVLRIARMASWSIDARRDRTLWSDNFHELLLLPPPRDGGSALTLRERVPAHHQEALRRFHESLSRDGKPADIHVDVQCGDGQIRHFRKVGIPRLDEAGRVVRIDGFLQDITEQKRMEAEQERLFTAIEQADQSVVITDADGSIVYVNRHFEQATGYAKAEALGGNPRILKSDKHDEGFYRDMWETLLRGETWRGQVVNRRKDGTLFTEDAVITPIWDAAGAITSYVAVKRDVTRERSLQQQLLQAQKMQAIGLLAGGVAHDFNNLLTVIINNVRFAQNGLPPGDPAREDLREVMEASRRATDLTRQLLAFSRRQIMVQEEADLNAVVAGMQKMLERILPETIRLHVLPREQPLPVRIDAGQIEQVIMNLVLNARDAIEGDGVITLDTGVHRPSREQEAAYIAPPDTWDEDMAMLSVSDTGGGIPAEIRDHIFEPFFTTKPPGEGTGLGLSTVFGIVRQHRGMLSLYSEEGQGSSFHVYLPLDPAQCPDGARAPRNVLLPSGTETVLLIEDDAGVRRISSRMIKSLGYQVLEAGTGREALEILRVHEGRVNLIISDMIMPGMNGREVAERAALIQPGIRVLFASGYPEAHLTQAGLVDPRMTLLRKPFQIDRLAFMLREILDRPAS